MLLKKLELFNFRQFKGKQEIIFADDLNKNVTVIFGENGRGKTSIFRALVFCLYGDRLLKQDEDTPEEELELINLKSLNENENIPVDMWVSATLLDDKTEYVLTRKMKGMSTNGKIDKEMAGQVLYINYPNGNTKIIDDIKKLEDIINTMLESKIKEYFLFDGEKMRRLTMAGKSQRNEIANGIRNLLQVGNLETAIKSVNKCIKKIEDEIIARSKGLYQNICKEIKDNNLQKEKIQEEITLHKDESRRAQNEIYRIDKILEKYKKDITAIEDKRKKEDELRTENYKIKEFLQIFKTNMGLNSLILLKDKVGELYEKIDTFKRNGDIPSEIKKEVIEKILLEEKCICGREIKINTKPFEQLTEWKNKLVNWEVESSLLDIWRVLFSIIGKTEGYSLNLIENLRQYAISTGRIEELNREIQILEAKINKEAEAREDIHDLPIKKTTILLDIGKIQGRIEELEIQLKTLLQKIENLEIERQRIEKDENLKSELISRKDIAKKVEEALKKLFHYYTVEIKKKLEKATNSFFNDMIDEYGKRDLGKITIQDDYSLQIMDKYGKPFLANISEGQRQLMSIAFISALLSVATSGQNKNMFLFMDTPFSRLSLEHSANLLKKIPENCTQWILLATGREFTKNEYEILKEAGRFGRFYWFQDVEQYETKIVEENYIKAAKLFPN